MKKEQKSQNDQKSQEANLNQKNRPQCQSEKPKNQATNQSRLECKEILLRPYDKVFVVGVSGMGKTSVTCKLMSKIPRWICYDTVGDFENMGPGVNKFEHLFELVEAKEPRIIFESDNKADFERLCSYIYELDNIFLVVDEVDKFCSANYVPPSFEKILYYGRKYNQGVISCTRRPADVSRSLTSQSKKILAFKMFEPRDIEYLSSIIPNAEEITLLNPFNFIYYDIDDRERRVYDGKYAQDFKRQANKLLVK